MREGSSCFLDLILSELEPAADLVDPSVHRRALAGDLDAVVVNAEVRLEARLREPVDDRGGEVCGLLRRDGQLGRCKPGRAGDIRYFYADLFGR